MVATARVSLQTLLSEDALGPRLFKDLKRLEAQIHGATIWREEIGVEHVDGALNSQALVAF